MNKMAILAVALTLLFATDQQCPSADISGVSPSDKVSVKSLFCGVGTLSMLPIPIPPGFESQFAVVVVEINSTSQVNNVSVSDFMITGKSGKITKFKRVTGIEIFERPHVPKEGIFAYYLNPGGTRPWTGTLPKGKIRLRIRMALLDQPELPGQYKLTIGGQVVVGKVDCDWPT